MLYGPRRCLIKRNHVLLKIAVCVAEYSHMVVAACLNKVCRLLIAVFVKYKLSTVVSFIMQRFSIRYAAYGYTLN